MSKMLGIQRLRKYHHKKYLLKKLNHFIPGVMQFKIIKNIIITYFESCFLVVLLRLYYEKV
jgi:hypothetical protein